MNWSNKKEVLVEMSREGYNLKKASEELRNDKDIVIAAVQNSRFALQFASEHLKNNKEVVLAAVQYHESALEYSSNDLKNDKEIVMIAVGKNGSILEYASIQLKNDSEVVMCAVKENSYALTYASDQLKNDKTLVIAAMIHSPDPPLEFVSEELKNDKEVVLLAVKKNGSYLEFASNNLKNDKEVVSIAVNKNGQAIKFASEKLRNDKQLFIAAITNDFYALEYASAQFKNDKEVLLVAVKSNVYALHYASNTLKNDKELLLVALENDITALDYVSEELKKDKEVIISAIELGLDLKKISKEFRSDKEVMLAAVKKDGLALKLASKELVNDKEVALAAIENCGIALEFASKKLKYDKDVVSMAVRKYGAALEFASDELKNDKEIVLLAIEKDKDALQFASKELQELLKNKKKEQPSSQENQLYTIKIFGEGNNIAKIYKKIDNNTRELHWLFSLYNNEPVVLCQFYTPTKVVIANWDAWIKIYDVETKEKIFDWKFGGKVGCRALISDNNKFLFVAHNGDKNNNILSVISLEDFSELHNNVFPRRYFREPDVFNIDITYMFLRDDGKLIFYFNESKQSKKDEKLSVNSHGFHVVDPFAGTIEQFVMPQAPVDASRSDLKLEVDKENKIGVMTYWSDIEVKFNTMKNPLFVFKIMLFDIYTFEIIKIIPVRDFTINQLCYRERKENKMAETLLSKERNEEYNDMCNDFFENLNSISFVKDEEAFWLCWRGGILRKIWYNGTLSPFVACEKVDYLKQEKAFENRTFHSHIHYLDNDKIILTDGENIGLNSSEENREIYIVNLKEIDLNTDKDFIAVEPHKILENENIKTIVPENFTAEMEQMGKVVIIVDDLKTEKSLLDALDQLITATEDFENAKNGDYFQLLISDKKGKKLNEEKFFKDVISIKGATEKITQIIDNFVKYENASALYIDEEKTALCYAVKELALFSSENINTVLRYLLIIDGEHDVFNIEKTIPAMLKKYANTELEIKLRIAFAMLDMQGDAIDFIYKGFCTNKTFCSKWISEIENAKKAAGFYQELLKMGFNAEYFDEKVKDSNTYKLLANAIYSNTPVGNNRKEESLSIKKMEEKGEKKVEKVSVNKEALIDLSGKKVCLTGKAPLSRTETTEILTAQGAIVQDSVNKTTEILICGEEDTESSKAKKAREQGVQILTYNQVINFESYKK